MDYEFLGGNLALDFTNTLHSHGMSDPGEDLKTTADLVEWAAQAGLLRDTETHKLGRVHPDQMRFRRALALRELLYEIFSRAAKGKKPQPQALRNFQSFYQNAIRRAEFHPVANHYDNSRNGMRRWCDMKACGNRAKVQRFRRNLSRAAGKSSGRRDDFGETRP
jgi:predicted RNA-binding Zn ribbon-like protein